MVANTTTRNITTPKEVFERMIEAANHHDLEAMVACFTPDYRSELPFTPERNFTGQAGVRNNWSFFFATMPDFQVEILRIAAEGNTVWAELFFHGTRADGTKQMMRGVNIAGIHEGQIAWGRLYQRSDELLKPEGKTNMANNVTTYNHGVAWEEGNGLTQAYSVNGTIYISGQFSHDMQGAFVGAGDVEAQTRQTLENLDRVLAGFNITRSNLAYMEIYLVNAQEHFERVVRLFREYVADHRPAGSLIGVTYLASPEQLIEISAVAHTD